MEKITFAEILKILLIDKDFRAKFQLAYEQAEQSLKIELNEAAWNLFMEYKGDLELIEFQKLIQEVVEKKRKLTTDMMRVAKSRVWQEFNDILSGKIQEKQQVEEIRNKLEQLITTQK